MAYQRKTFLGVITARGGSKGLPGKNIRPFCGKPLIAWSIEAGLKSKYLDELVVSTDSPQIAKVAKKYGAEAPFLRPARLSTDKASSYAALRHTIEFYLKEKKRKFDYLVLLEPTSPLREAADIDEPIRRLVKNRSARAIASVCRAEAAHPVFLMRVDHKGFVRGYARKKMGGVRRQDIDDVYFPEGTIYISEIKTLLAKDTFFHEKTLAYEVPRWKSHEIDEIEDLVVVEALLKYRRSAKK